MKPKFSIITVNYNNLDGLKTTVNSVKSQTFQDFEYIVIDGNSTDGSAVYLKQNSSLLDFWVSEPDNGVYQAMNKGIENASGEYLLFLNSGDHFYNTKVLEENIKHIKDSDIIYFDLEVVEGDETFIKTYPNTLSFSYFVEDTLPHPATFIKKEAFLKSNLYKEDFKIVSDWKFFIDAICKYNLSYKHIAKPLSTFYIGGLSSNPKNQIIKFNEKEAVLKTDYAIFTQDVNDILLYRKKINNLRNSRTIKLLVKLGLLNKF